MGQDIDRERWQRISPILDSLLSLPTEARAAHLDEACAGDAELRRHVEELLAAEQRGGAFLAVGALERAAPLIADVLAEREPMPPPTERRVGVYRLLCELGEGGMGTVYLAERVDGHFEQQVAVKVLKQGLASEDARRRFLQERQILARLEHPGIARLLDGGVTTAGAPFFVMERVEGRPVTDYCNDRSLGVEARLRVFLEICEAVQYAHRNLVVHRDLKPSNILVDAAGRVKLLDFGIAKILAEGEDGAPADATRTTLRALTPEYAAPEQVRGDPVTTATDSYSLGVLLYELLAGRRPYDVSRGSAAEIERAILEQEPVRPSARAAAGTGLPGLAAREVSRFLRGDVDGIVLKALEKTPERRYPSAEALATDIRRHLEGLPVTARADRLAYRVRKFVRRHRLGVSAAALVLLSLVVGLVGMGWQARRAEAEARKASAVKDFLKSLFSASDPAQAQGKALTAKQLLDDGARRIEAELKAQPDVQSEVRRLIADVYDRLGEYDRARSLLTADLEQRRRSDGSRSTTVAELLTQLGDVNYQQSRFEEALPMFEEALSILRETRGERTPEGASVLRSLANIKRFRGDLEAAEDLQQRALAIVLDTRGEDSSDAANTRSGLAFIHADACRYAEAVVLQGQVAAWRVRHLGADHPSTLDTRHNHAHLLLSLGRAGEATRVIEEVVQRRRRVLGERHDYLGKSLHVLARALDMTGRSEDALPRMAEALAIHREVFGPRHLQVALDLSWLAMIEARTGRLAEAERDSREALGLFTANPQAPPRLLAGVRSNTGLVLMEAGRLEEAGHELEEVVRLSSARRLERACLARVLGALGDIARRQADPTRAVELGREALGLQRRTTAEDTLAMALIRAHAGAGLCAAGQRDEGERLLRGSVVWMERAFPGGHFDLATGRFLLGEALINNGRAAEARPFLQGALEWREAHLGPVDPRTVAARQALAKTAS